ncbi:MAG: UDP-glucose 4-epimerase GalE [Mizugakiibacter sp.]|uniref:UDP-glucose 4-epimerase GalE n=1 Tax=Mizugakiibacter sp. TaxID=1972610 RepID=UPI0031C8807E|nr:UDP-glucose 4-epimerase GalE [Xanthomonadaceae bacterium]
MKVLVAGGAGYIGSHTCVELIQRGHEVLILDNLCNASPRVLERLAAITGLRPDFVEADVRDARALAAVFRERPIDVVIHFAALKAVGESWQKPLAYFDNNITGTIVLLQAMRDAGIRHLVFSSSATVYGDPDACPIPESAPLRVTNPYGRTKLVMEELIGDLCAADPAFRAAVLRYFNPVGAHASGLIGEDPAGTPNNLMPYVCQVAVGRRPYLNVYGNDYPTRDGTGVRDYIHVVDLARAHVDAIDTLARTDAGFTVNLGTGSGCSVLEMVRAFEEASGRPVPVRFAPRRAGDVAACYADPALAARLMGWKAEFGIERMCADAWRWQSANPHGYAE